MIRFLSSRNAVALALITLFVLIAFIPGNSQAYPDVFLKSTHIEIINERIYIGDTVMVNVTVINSGIEDVIDLSVGLYDGDPRDGGVLLSPEQRVFIPKNNYTNVMFTFEATEKHRQLRSIWVSLDDSNEIEELDENNNIAGIPIRILVREDLAFVLRVIGMGLFITFSSMMILAFAVFITGKIVGRFFPDRPVASAEDQTGPFFQSTGKGDHEEVAAVSAAVMAFLRGR